MIAQVSIDARTLRTFAILDSIFFTISICASKLESYLLQPVKSSKRTTASPSMNSLIVKHSLENSFSFFPDSNNFFVLSGTE